MLRRCWTTEPPHKNTSLCKQNYARFFTKTVPRYWTAEEATTTTTTTTTIATTTTTTKPTASATTTTSPTTTTATTCTLTCTSFVELPKAARGAEGPEGMGTIHQNQFQDGIQKTGRCNECPTKRGKTNSKTVKTGDFTTLILPFASAKQTTSSKKHKFKRIYLTTPIFSTGAGKRGGVDKILLSRLLILTRTNGYLSTPPSRPAPVDKRGVDNYGFCGVFVK